MPIPRATVPGRATVRPDPPAAHATPAGTTPGSAVLVVDVGWAAGIALGPWPGLSPLLLVLSTLTMLVALVLARGALGRLIALGLLAMLLGQARLALVPAVGHDGALASQDGPVVLTGRVLDAPVPRGSRVEVAIEVETIADAQSAQAGQVGQVGQSARPSQSVRATNPPTILPEPRPRVLLRAPTLRIAAGDRIETRGRLARPRSRPGWPLAEILARRGIGWVLDTGGARVIEPGGASLSRWLVGLRGQFEANTRAVLPEPHASLVAGIVFGSRVGLPSELKAAMSATGTSHLTAVSGANVAMVAGALTLLAGRLLGRVPAAVLAMVGVWLYTLLVGAPPSATRAAMMASVALVAFGLGRQPDAIAGLVVAAGLLLAWDPGLVGDLGFQLSVAATAGLIVLTPTLETWLARLIWLPQWLRGQVAVAVAAQIATLPILLGAFQRLSPVSLPANVLAAPTIPPLMAVGAALAAVGSLPGFDVLLGWGAWAMASLLLLVIEGFAGLPGATVAVGRAPDWLPWLWYGALACWVLAGSADARALGLRPAALRVAAVGLPLMLVGWLLAGSLLMGSPLAGTMVAGWMGIGRPGVEVALLDVEPASAFVRLPSGRSLLATAGPPGPGLVSSVGGLLDLNESAVDVVIGPSGLRTGVDLLALADESTEPPESPDSGDSAAEALAPGARINLGQGVAVVVVDVRVVPRTDQRSDGRAADVATVADLAVLVGDVAILLPGAGPPSDRWADLAPEAVTVGRMPSSAVAWARVMPPRRWLLLVGEPAQERARGESGVPFLTRREHGQVEISIEGDDIVVRTERCADGTGCLFALPPPNATRLAP